MTLRLLFFFLTCGLIAFFSLASCKFHQDHSLETAGKTKSDSLWLQFANAMEQRDITYLKQHSLETIQCADCNCGNEPYNEMIKADFAFTHCLDKLMHLQKLSDQTFTTSGYGKDEIQVIYSVNSPQAPEEVYNLIFLFKKIGETYLFKGMIVT